MDYMIGDLVELTDLAPRTIRTYIARKMVPPPVGNGPAAVYGDEHVLRLTAIKRLRAEGRSLDAVQAQLAAMSPAQVRAYVRRTQPREPAPPPAPQAAPSPVDPPALDGEPVPSARSLPPVDHGTRATLTARAWADAGSLPETPRWGIFPLLPGMALMVREDAAPIVRNSAAEILARFGTQS